jgi:hypothetical protein
MRASPTPRPVARRGAIFLVAAVLGACPGPPEGPESQVRALLAEAEAAAEAKDAGALKRLVSERYADEDGHDRQAIAGLLTYTFLRHQSVHLLTRIRAIAFPEPGRGTATVFVAMAGTPISGTDALTRVRADLYRFDFELADEGDGAWRVTRAAWRPATGEDFRP